MRGDHRLCRDAANHPDGGTGANPASSDTPSGVIRSADRTAILFAIAPV